MFIENLNWHNMTLNFMNNISVHAAIKNTNLRFLIITQNNTLLFPFLKLFYAP